MSLWKPSNKKTKKNSNTQQEASTSTEYSSITVLPDVIAGLSLDASANSSQLLHSADRGIMLGYSSQFTDSEEPRGRRREQRPRREHHTHTPHGLGAVSTAGFMPQQNFDVNYPVQSHGRYSRKEDSFMSWPTQMLQSCTTAEISPVENNSNNFYEDSNYIGHACSVVSPDVRIRSVSSGPHGPREIRKSDQRVRCSSASRNRQPRVKPKRSNQEFTMAVAEQSSLSNVHQDFPLTSQSFPRAEYQEPVSPVLAEGSSPRKGSFHEEFSQECRNGGKENCMHSQIQPNLNMQSSSYGYQIPDLEALLTEASPSRPANLPMVLASSSRLHNMRRSNDNQTATQGPVRPFLPLGIIVNAIFKTRDWLYIRTAHGAEGYVPFRVCLPLGIIPQSQFAQSSQAAMADSSNAASPWEFRRSDVTYSQYHCVKPTNMNMDTDTLAPQPRGRPRERRRAESTNQTDLQKLQPNANGSLTERSLGNSSAIGGCTIPHIV